MNLEKIAFNAFWWEDLTTEEKIIECVQTLKKIGYNAVEFKLDSFDLAKEWGDEFQRATKIAQQEGLQVTDFVILRNPCSDDEAVRKQSVQNIEKTICAAAKAGVPLVNMTTGGGTMSRQLNQDDWFRPAVEDSSALWNNLVESLEQIIATAKTEGVTIALEPCHGNLVHDLHTTLELFRRIDAPELCLTFDPSHFLLYRNDIQESIRLLGDKIKLVHVKDAVGTPGEFGKDFLFPILGEGAIDFPSLFHALDEINYDGFASLEFESFKYMNDVLNNDPERAAQISFDALMALMK